MVIFDLDVEVGTIDASPITRDILFMGQLYSRRRLSYYSETAGQCANVWPDSHRLAVQLAHFKSP